MPRKVTVTCDVCGRQETSAYEAFGEVRGFTIKCYATNEPTDPIFYHTQHRDGTPRLTREVFLCKQHHKVLLYALDKCILEVTRETANKG